MREEEQQQTVTTWHRYPEGREPGDTFPTRAKFLEAIAEEGREWRARVQREMEADRARWERREMPVGFRVVEEAAPVVARGRAEARHPFHVRAFDDSGTLKFTVEPGTYDGVHPTLGGTALNDDPAPVGTLGTGERWVYLKASHALLATDGYVYSGFLDGAVNSGKPEIVVETVAKTDPLGPNTTGVYYILLASFEDGVKLSQDVRTSLAVEVGDDGTAASKGFCFINAEV